MKLLYIYWACFIACLTLPRFRSRYDMNVEIAKLACRFPDVPTRTATLAIKHMLIDIYFGKLVIEGDFTEEAMDQIVRERYISAYL